MKAALDGYDLADEGLELWRGGDDAEGFAEHGLRFVEEGGVFTEEGYEGLAFGEAVA